MLMIKPKKTPFAWGLLCGVRSPEDKAETKLARHFHQPVELQRLSWDIAQAG